MIADFRVQQYVLPPKSVVFTGCVGDDALADQLRAANAKEGVESAYLVKKGEATGACAVILTGHNRSVVGRRRALSAVLNLSFQIVGHHSSIGGKV